MFDQGFDFLNPDQLAQQQQRQLEQVGCIGDNRRGFAGHRQPHRILAETRQFDLFSVCSSEQGASPSVTTAYTATPAIQSRMGNGSPHHLIDDDNVVEEVMNDEGQSIELTAFHEAVFEIFVDMVKQGARMYPSHTAKEPFYRASVMNVMSSSVASGEAVIIALVLLRRLQRHSLRAVSPFSARRIFAACVMIAAKLHDDHAISAEALAKTAGVPKHVLIGTERQALHWINYALFVEPSEYESTAAAIGRISTEFLDKLTNIDDDASSEASLEDEDQ